MPVIPPEILPLLDDLDIVDPAECQRRMLSPHPLSLKASACYCEDHAAPLQIPLRLTRLAGRRIFIGQCAQCHVVFVRDAVLEAHLAE